MPSQPTTSPSATSPASHVSIGSTTASPSASVNPADHIIAPLSDLKASLPKYLIIGSIALAFVIVIGLIGWWWKRRKRLRRFKLDREDEEWFRQRKQSGLGSRSSGSSSSGSSTPVSSKGSPSLSPTPTSILLHQGRSPETTVQEKVHSREDGAGSLAKESESRT